MHRVNIESGRTLLVLYFLSARVWTRKSYYDYRYLRTYRL